jgi:hypothetical protein
MDSFNSREIAKKFSHCFANILIKDTKEIRPVFFEQFSYDDESRIPSVVLQNVVKPAIERDGILGVFDTVQSREPMNTFKILETPHAKVFDYKGISFVYRRSPARQWMKGITSGNSSIHSPVAEMTASLDTKVYAIKNSRFDQGVSAYASLLMDNYAGSLAKALSDIDEHKLISRSINNKYFISLFPNKEKQYVLFRMAIPLAYYNRDSNTFTIINELYKQEVHDFCYRNRIYSIIRT